VVVGANGEGKTNLLEAIAWLATLSSFRGAPNEALVRVGAEHAVVRAEAEREGRTLLLEAEVPARGGRIRVQVNRQPLGRARCWSRSDQGSLPAGERGAEARPGCRPGRRRCRAVPGRNCSPAPAAEP